MQSRRASCRITALIIFALATIPTAAVRSFAQDGSDKPPLAVPRAASEIRIDAVLDEPAWEGALRMEVPYEIWPGENTPALVKTELFLTYDGLKLYVAFKAYDGDTGAIRAFVTDRDHLGSHDFVGIQIDTFNDGRRAYGFFVNPLGVQYDGTRDDFGSGTDSSWDAIWDSAGRITDFGYVVEMAIPFNQIGFQRTDGPQTWGFCGTRMYPRDRRRENSTNTEDRNVSGAIRQFTKVRGFENIEPGMDLQIMPTVTAVRSDERGSLPGGDLEKANQDAEVGLTASWGMTSNLTLSATANPDFSQVEADALQLDINQPFALYYEEKRPFFTEGADYFQTNAGAVYTRTMRDPQWGFKLAGKEGSNALGAIVVRDNITNLIFPGSQGSRSTSLDLANTSSIFRYRRDISGKYSLGLLLTDREGQGYFNRVLSFDTNLRLTNKDSVAFELLGSWTDYPDAVARGFAQPEGEFSDRAWGLAYQHETRNYLLYAEHLDYGAGFRADLGFIPRVGYTRSEVGANYKWIGTNDTWYGNIGIGSNWDQTKDKDGSLIEEEVEGFFWLEGPMQSGVSGGVGHRDRFYNNTYFEQWFSAAEFSIRPTHDLDTSVYVRWEDAIDYAHTRAGKLIRITPSLGYNVGKNLRLSLDYELQQMSIEGERLYLANLADTTIIYNFNVRTFLRAIFQYTDVRQNPDLYAFTVNSKSSTLFTQLLFSYKINPQTVLFLGYSDDYLGTQDFGLTQTGRTFFIKLGYAWLL